MPASASSAFVYLGLGSNLGDRLAHLRGAVEALRGAGVQIRRLAPWLESAFVGPGGPQPDYLNTVLEASTSLLPLPLLNLTQSIEAAAGRVARTHMLPRPLDIDILGYRGWCVMHPRLVLPHPRLGERRFVLESLAALGVLDDCPQQQENLRRLRDVQRVTLYDATKTQGT
jgi:2-amino-4-hydroxy-6-hydroxymethyldihydropteridine diphosphokinase